MKKIVLGCAAVLLSLGLLAGCNNDAPIEDVVIINVDSSATIVVGDTLELAYTVDPAKAEVVAASDNESIVTADAQDGTLYLHGVAEGSAVVTLVGTYKKYAEANTNISVKVVTEAEVEQEPGPETGGEGGPSTTYPAPTGEEEPAYFGFEVDGVGYYMTGETVSGYAYEGVLTTSVEEAVLVSIEKGTAENEFYLSFGEEGSEKYITIIETTNTSGTHINLSYASEKAPIYWNETYGCWGDESEEYFLCYNAAYGCLYCSAIADWIDSSPIATLIEPAEVSELTIHGPSKVNVGETITLEAVVNLGASNTVTWSTEDSSQTYITLDASTGEVTGVSKTESPVAVTATAANGVSASIEISVVNLVPQQVNGDALVSGETYYLGYQNTNTWYFFNGTTDSYGDYLLCSTTLSEAVAIKVTIDNESYGFTFELEGTEYTIYAWPSISGSGYEYGEITFIETSNLSSAKSGAVTTFTYNSSSSRFEVVLTNGTWYFSTYADKTAVSLSDSSKSYAASHFYTFVEE